MGNGKQKLFNASDFDKDKKNSRKETSMLSKIIGCVAVVAILIGGAYYAFSGDTSNDQSEICKSETVQQKKSIQTSDKTEEIAPKTLEESSNQIESTTTAKSENSSSDNAVLEKPKVSGVSNKIDIPAQYKEELKEAEVNLSGTLEEKAKQVIRGNFGNGQERKIKLGSQYSVIQNKVNELYKQGLVN